METFFSCLLHLNYSDIESNSRLSRLHGFISINLVARIVVTSVGWAIVFDSPGLVVSLLVVHGQLNHWPFKCGCLSTTILQRGLIKCFFIIIIKCVPNQNNNILYPTEMFKHAKQTKVKESFGCSRAWSWYQEGQAWQRAGLAMHLAGNLR